MEINSKNLNKVLKLTKNVVKCPTCKKKSKDLFTPFCSKKCSDLDLMKWLNDEIFEKENY
tara:strand:+ start:305 stop:484 length:180 start_codon:yes stop_codon:yes gene_type:complete